MATTIRLTIPKRVVTTDSDEKVVTDHHKVVTSFECTRLEHSEYDVPWHEVPVVSEKWLKYSAEKRISNELSSRGAPREMLDKQAHHPPYYGLPYIVREDGPPTKWLDGPSQWSWEDGVASFSMPRDGDVPPGGGFVFRIRYEFPDGGQPIWHQNVVPALDLIASQGLEEVPIAFLRKVINKCNAAERRGDSR